MTRRGFLLMILGAALCWLASQAGLWSFLLVWLGVDFLIVGIAYLRRAHGIFGKRPNGTLPWWSWGLFLPYLIYTSFVWHMFRLLSREPAHGVVSDEIIVGRRQLPWEVPSGLVNYVDLTAEFCEPKPIRCQAGYLCLPVLDAGAPEPELLRRFVGLLKPGRTFIHCAQGHGRTGLFALAALHASRAVTSADEGLRLLQTVRPGIRLNREQRRCLDEFIQLVLHGGTR
jgi:hypothetical protein